MTRPSVARKDLDNGLRFFSNWSDQWHGKSGSDEAMRGWRELICRQSSGGLSVPEFCRREAVNASLFRRWRSVLKDSDGDRRVISSPLDRVTEGRAPFIDLRDFRSEGPRFEVRLELGAGIVLSIVRS